MLEGLGLDQIVSMDGKPGALADDMALENPEPLSSSPADKRTTTETMIAAHQALVDADPNNLCKFKDVLDYLKQDLRREETVRLAVPIMWSNLLLGLLVLTAACFYWVLGRQRRVLRATQKRLDDVKTRRAGCSSFCTA